MSSLLWPLVRTPEVVANYKTIKEQLGHDEAVFRAMSNVARERGFFFKLPTDSTQYEQKHRELEQSFAKEVSLNRRGVFFDLVEELHSQLVNDGKEAVAKRLRGMVSLPSRDDSLIKLNAEGAWIIQWKVTDVDPLGDHEYLITLAVYGRKRLEIIPWRVVEYISSGIVLFRKGAYAAALALMTAAVEATLRDALATRGYEFKKGAGKVDTYKTSSVNLGVADNSYTLTYSDPMPSDPASLAMSQSSNLPVSVKIRRLARRPEGSKTNLLLTVPDFLLDNLSSNEVETAAWPKTISGLGHALSIARSTEKLIDASDLPPDLDDVLKAVRNNLLHLSRSSLNVPLPQYNSRSKTGTYTLEDFVEDKELVLAFITDIPQFVNAQYLKLCHLGSSSRPE